MNYVELPAEGEAIQFNGNDKECTTFCPSLVDPEDDKPSLQLRNRLIYVGDWIVKLKEHFLVYSDKNFQEQFQIKQFGDKVKSVMLLGDSSLGGHTFLIIQE